MQSSQAYTCGNGDPNGVCGSPGTFALPNAATPIAGFLKTYAVSSKFPFPTQGISVFYVGNFANCGTCKAYKSVSRKVRQVRKAIPITELRGLCELGVRAIREFCQLTQEVLSTDTRSCVNRQKKRATWRPLRGSGFALRGYRRQLKRMLSLVCSTNNSQHS